MKSLFLKLSFFVLLLSIVACSDDDAGVVIIEEGKFYQEAQLEVVNSDDSPWASAVKGEKVVFEYTYSHPGNPDAVDDEFSYFLLWEIDAENTSFIIENPKEHAAFYSQSCFCPRANSLDISGRIEGEKINSTTWKVDLDITVTTSNGSEQISHERYYKISTLE